MKRPLGVILIVILVLVSSFLTVAQTIKTQGGHPGKKLIAGSVVLSILALLAVEGLWMLRPYAFLMFTLWAISAMMAMVMTRLSPGSPGHGIRLFEPIVYAGLAYAAAALYLRRVV